MRTAAKQIRAKYGNAAAVDAEFIRLRSFWDDKCARLQIDTPGDGLSALINQWTLYQSEINVMFSRFSSFIEVGGRTGLGVPRHGTGCHVHPALEPGQMSAAHRGAAACADAGGVWAASVRPRLVRSKSQARSALNPPRWYLCRAGKKSYTALRTPARTTRSGWLGAIVNYIKETGETAFVTETVTYADGGEGTVYEHIRRILDFSAREVGAHGICKGLRADWNDCLNLGGGESAMVSFPAPLGARTVR